MTETAFVRTNQTSCGNPTFGSVYWRIVRYPHLRRRFCGRCSRSPAIITYWPSCSRMSRLARSIVLADGSDGDWLGVFGKDGCEFDEIGEDDPSAFDGGGLQEEVIVSLDPC